MLAIVWLTAVLISVAAGADFCDPLKSKPNEICVVTGYDCGEKDFTFKQLPQDVDTYTIVFDNARVDCQRSLFKIGFDTPGSQVKNLKILATNSVIIGRNVSINAGDTSSTDNEIAMFNSTINASMTVASGLGYNATELSIYFTGSCTTQRDQDSSTEFNLTQLKSYGYTVLPKGKSMLLGDNLHTEEYFGSGGDETLGNLTFGGGRIYLRSATIKADNDSRILANGFYTKDSTDAQLAGTGGVIMIAANTMDIPKTESQLTPRNCIIQALGGFMFKNTSISKLGSGGRVYIELSNTNMTQKYPEELVNVVAVGQEGASCMNMSCYGTAGSLYVKIASEEDVIVYSAVANAFVISTSICYTVLHGAELTNRDNPIDLQIKNSVNAIMFGDDLPKDEDTGNCTLTFDTLSLLNNAGLLTLFNCGSPSLIAANPDPYAVYFKAESMYLVHSGMRVRSPMIFSGSRLVMNDSAYIIMGGINFYYPASQTILVSLSPIDMILSKQVAISSAPSAAHKRGYPSTLIIEPKGSFSIIDSADIKAQRVIMNFTNIDHQELTGINVIGSDYYCSSADLQPGVDHKTEKLLSSFFSNTLFWREANIFNDQLSYNSSLIILARNLITSRSSFSKFGYIAIGTRGWLNLTSSAVLNASAAGCPARDLSISEIGSKYLKICKVLGGSNVGRGTLGSQKNFDNCKYVMSVPRYKGALYSPSSGGGGQKNHQMETDQSGYGGGIIALYNPTLIMDGKLSADGGDKSEQDYTMIAGGAGGSISLRGSQFSISGSMSVKGGANDLEVDIS